MWHTTTCTSYRDFLTKMVQLATSKHISAATVNAGGSGYVVGDVLTIPHAGAAMAATAEVTSVSSGAVTGIKLRNQGAYSNRVATVAVNAGGSGYPVSSTAILAIGGGTTTCPAKVSATVNGSGVVTAVSLFEGGGAYTSAPAGTGAATSTVGPSGVTGSGCTVNTTMTGLVGTSGVATTGGTGTGCTLDLTLTSTGWAVQRDRNDYSTNGLNDEKEVILLGTVSGGDAPYIGWRSYSIPGGIETRYALICNGFDNYNSLLSYDSQVNPLPPVTTPTTNGSFLLLRGSLSAAPTSFVAWWSITGRRIISVCRLQVGAPVTATCYVSGYFGLLNPFGTATENPYPLAIFSTTWAQNRDAFDGGIFVTGLTEAMTDVTGRSPCVYRRPSDGSCVRVHNIINDGSGNGTFSRSQIVYPVGSPVDVGPTPSNDQIVFIGSGSTNTNLWNNGIIQPQFVASLKLYPFIGTDETLLIPATIISAPDGGANGNEHTVRGELDNVFWLSATKADGTALNAEDTVTIGTDRYRIFPNVARSELYSYFALKEA